MTDTAAATDFIHDPVHKVAYAFLREGDTLWVDTLFQPGGSLPEHLHPTIDERWSAVDGPLRAKIDGRWRDLRPENGFVEVPARTRHALRNESDRPVLGRAQAMPAGHIEEFLTDAARAAQEGLYDARNLPRSLRGAIWAAALMRRHRDETVMCFPPRPVQRLLEPLGRFENARHA
jgi:mannose-6-phosphate isomerase-like protein (cupin superfamily)